MRDRTVLTITLTIALLFAGAALASEIGTVQILQGDGVSDMGVVGAPSDRAMLSTPGTSAVSTAEPLWRWPAEGGAFDARFWQTAPIITDGQAYYRDVVVGSHIIVNTTTGLTEGESWGCTFISPTGVVTGPTTVYMRGGCFVGPGWRDCYWDMWGYYYYDLAFYVPVQCKEIGVWRVQLLHNGATFAEQTFTLLPQVEESRIVLLSQHDNLWKDNAFDSICYDEANPGQRPILPCPAEPLPTGVKHSTISRFGCTITAATMLLKYHGITKDPFGVDLTPATLNTWLTEHGGYNSTGSIIWRALPLFAEACGGVLHPEKNHAPLSRELCMMGPQFIQVKSGDHHHWYLAYGEDMDRTGYKVRDPNNGRTPFFSSSLWHSRSGAPTYYKEGQTFTDGFNGISIDFYCPVELVLTDPLGQRTGYDPRSAVLYEEALNAGYDNKDTVSLDDEPVDPNPSKSLNVWGGVDGDYTLEVIGTETGTYKADFEAWYNYAGYSRANIAAFDAVGIAKDVVHTYSIHYENKAGSTSKLSGGFDGGGQRPKDVNKFLSYANPSKSHTQLAPGANSVAVMIYYGTTILPESFNASLNGVNVASQFHPLPGGHETVILLLSPGSNVLLLSTEGNVANRTATDTDRLVFLVP